MGGLPWPTAPTACRAAFCRTEEQSVPTRSCWTQSAIDPLGGQVLTLPRRNVSALWAQGSTSRSRRRKGEMGNGGEPRRGARQNAAPHETRMPTHQADPSCVLQPAEENQWQSRRAFLTLECKAGFFFYLLVFVFLSLQEKPLYIPLN